MLKLMNTILLGKVLSDASRRQLETWLWQATVGQDRIKAGLPPTWRIGHKTGTWETHVNDIAIVWPPGRAPILVTACYAARRGPASAQCCPQRDRPHRLRNAARQLNLPDSESSRR